MKAKTTKTTKAKPTRGRDLGNAPKAKTPTVYPKPDPLGPVDPGRLLKTREVAARLAVSPATVGRLVKQGRLAVVRVGARSLRVRPQDLEAFIQSSREKQEAGRS